MLNHIWKMAGDKLQEKEYQFQSRTVRLISEAFRPEKKELFQIILSIHTIQLHLNYH